MAIEEHRTLVKLEAPRPQSIHELFRLWESVRQTDKAFCAASILTFLKATNEAEAALYAEARGRIPMETSQIPMFRLLGTPPGQKRYVVENGSHFVPRARLIQETLAWLDKWQPVK